MEVMFLWNGVILALLVEVNSLRSWNYSSLTYIFTSIFTSSAVGRLLPFYFPLQARYIVQMPKVKRRQTTLLYPFFFRILSITSPCGKAFTESER